MACAGELAIFGKETEKEPTDNSCSLLQMHQCYLRGAETHKSHFALDSNYCGFSLYLPFSTDTEATAKVISTVMNMYKYSYESDHKGNKEAILEEEGVKNAGGDKRVICRKEQTNIAYFLSCAKSGPTLYLPIRCDSRGETVCSGEGRRDGNEA